MKLYFNIAGVLISPLIELRKTLKRNNMIHVNYDKKDNYPHHKKIILFDRDAFQSLGHEGILKLNKKYNLLCPQVFVMECLAPNRASESVKKGLEKGLKLIENPIVLTGNTHISPIIQIPRGKEYPSILTAEEIARNCIISAPITMESVTPEKLISHYGPRISNFKEYVKKQTEQCDKMKDELSIKQIISMFENLARKRRLNVKLSREEIKKRIKNNENFNITDELACVATKALTSMDEVPISKNIDLLVKLLKLTDKESEILNSHIQDSKKLTIENYSHLGYPIYIYYLFRYMVHARQFNTKHLDQSYVRDFRYFHYLNFCDRFITNESSTPHIVNSFPYDDIKNTTISTAPELKMELS